ncbi:helicase/secretion neighborhood TadE-like protein [Lentzea fradiae]|uniref:Helicase/secretion neighborhood TadE-like protein n=1 Tax=Lentzea fradiae TaxID=200378 RepID=A0A1G8AR07_9PSEU|nr:Rv3654c family TadE-like protein [Lentzea fradiae]SDH23431.1 helicase/secretion neighborhood TadE-like protein [Lentzea fradiae]
MSGRAAGDERGSAAVSGVVAMLVLIVLAVAGMRAGAVVVVRHRVNGAADLAALAAAAHLAEGEGRACELAKLVAEENAAVLVRCSATGWEVVAEVSATTPFGPVNARARAGPAEDRERLEHDERSTRCGERTHTGAGTC